MNINLHRHKCITPEKILSHVKSHLILTVLSEDVPGIDMTILVFNIIKLGL